MSGAAIGGPGSLSLYARARAMDRASRALYIVFLLALPFYIWTAKTSLSVSPASGIDLHNGQTDGYNQLANAFIHFHLSLGRAPSNLLRLTDPFNVRQNGGVTSNDFIHDYVLYNRHLYITWGPVPAIVFLVPMHLLGFLPAPGLTVLVFSLAGLAFALMTLRILLRKLGESPVWMCVFSGLALVFSSVVPFILRRPAAYEEAISGGYCFAMAGIWLAMSMLAGRRASSRRLLLMSLCFGLAAGSRPTLVFAALIMVPVYMAMGPQRTRRNLVMLAAPLGTCILLLLAYNEARFGQLLEIGARYQLASYDPRTAHFASLSYIFPGLWLYGVSPPRPTILFPFAKLGPPPLFYPFHLPAHYLTPEMTGGLLPMAPILLFLLALPWLWRRRPALLGALALPLLSLTAAGIAILVFVSYQLFSTTERYEVDFSTLFLLGALASWLALSMVTRGPIRRLVRIVGGVFVVWGCIAGLLISFVGYSNSLATNHTGTWNALQSLGAPLSTAIATAEHRPILAEVTGQNLKEMTQPGYTGFGTTVTGGWVIQSEAIHFTVVSPDARKAALLAAMSPGYVNLNAQTLQPGGSVRILMRGPASQSTLYGVPAGSHAARIPVELKAGVNRISLQLLSQQIGIPKPLGPGEGLALLIGKISLLTHD